MSIKKNKGLILFDITSIFIVFQLLVSTGCCMNNKKLINSKTFMERLELFAGRFGEGKICKQNLPEKTIIIIPRSLKCKNRRNQIVTLNNSSQLYVADNLPSANFGHKIQIGIIDNFTKKGRIINSEWPPQIIIDKSIPVECYSYKNPTRFLHNIFPLRFISELFCKIDITPCNQVSDGSCDREFPNVAKELLAQKNEDTVVDKIWAIIICGGIPDEIGKSNELAFAKDTHCMYSILRSYGVPKEQIFYIMPDDLKQKIANMPSTSNFKFNYIRDVYQNNQNQSLSENYIKDVFDTVKKRIDNKCEKFIFLICSHGGDGSVSMFNNKIIIQANDLRKMLDEIKCGTMYILLESCRSGSFIGCYDKKPDCLLRDYLIRPCGKKSNRIVIASASGDETSFSDIDYNCPTSVKNYEDNSDRGTEFMGAFIESFTQISADKDGNCMISIQEAFNYAKERSINANENCYSFFGYHDKCNHPVIRYSKGIDPKNEFFFWKTPSANCPKKGND